MIKNFWNINTIWNFSSMLRNLYKAFFHFQVFQFYSWGYLQLLFIFLEWKSQIKADALFSSRVQSHRVNCENINLNQTETHHHKQITEGHKENAEIFA